MSNSYNSNSHGELACGPSLEARTPAPRKPPLIVREQDVPALLAVAFDGLMTVPRIAGALLEEVERASIVSSREEWSGAVVPGSKVLYREGHIEPPRWKTLVIPPVADNSYGMLSVLTTLGAGLLGLSKGQTITWDDRHGGALRLEIINVIDPKDVESGGDD